MSQHQVSVLGGIGQGLAAAQAGELRLMLCIDRAGLLLVVIFTRT